MVSSISSSTATQATYAPAARNNPDQTVATPGTIVTVDDQGDAAAPTQSAASAASARLGDQLNAQADASRVQRAVDEASTGSGTATDSEAATVTATGAAPAGGAPAAASTATSTTPATTNDYVAEADTNSDKTVSDDEQAAYETRLRQQAEAAAATKAAAKEAAPQDALTAEVRATYGVDEAAEPVLDITA